jgi:hypothetical protein
VNDYCEPPYLWKYSPLPVGDWAGETFVLSGYYYCDESGKDSDEYVSFGGYIGKINAWEKFCHEWEGQREAKKLPPIHVRAMRFRKGEWEKHANAFPGKDAWENEIVKLLGPFAGLVSQSSVHCVACHVHATTFDKCAKLKSAYGDPFYLALHHCLRSAVEIAKKWSPNPLGIVIDLNSETAEDTHRLVTAYKKKHADDARSIGSLCFVNDDLFPGVQAADVLVNLARRAITDGVIVRDGLLGNLTSEHYQPMVYGERALEELEKLENLRP